MAGKVLTEEDFEKSGGPTKEDTSSKGIPKDQMIDANQKFDQDGKPIIEEPEKKETPKKEEVEEEVEPQSKPSDFKPKHKTWEETEKARLELERGFTEKAMRLSETERELEKFKKPPVEHKEQTIDDQITEIMDAARAEIKTIPIEYGDDGKATPGSLANYDRQAWIIMGKANRKISRLEIQEANKQIENERGVVSKLYKKATEKGLKTDDELQLLGDEYQKTDSSLKVEDRIEKAVENTQSRLSRLREGFVENQERDKKEKEDLKVLGRGSTRKETKGTKEERPPTMSSQLAELNEKRRMTREDLR